jgi:hypothetical protein
MLMGGAQNSGAVTTTPNSWVYVNGEFIFVLAEDI